MIIRSKSKTVFLIYLLWHSTTLASSAFRYIDEKGCIKGVLATVIDTLKIDLSLYRPTDKEDKSLPVNHIFNAYNFLKFFYQDDGDYQKHQEFYRKGGKAEYQLSIEQAQQILRIHRGYLALYKSSDPIEKKKADVVICAGQDWSLEKRIFSFKKFLEAGFDCNNIFFISRTSEIDESVKRALNLEKFNFIFNGRKVYALLIPYQQNNYSDENILFALKSLISKEFYLISDPEYAEILVNSFTTYGRKYGITCLGEFIRPITSDVDEYIQRDLVGYKFYEYISNKEDQFKAAANAFLNQLGYQVMQELKLFSLEK